MRFLLGVSVFCFMAAWIFLLEDFVEPDLFVAGSWLVLGGVCALVGIHAVRPRQVSGWYVMFGIPAILGFFVVPFPFNIGFVFVGVGAVFVVVKWWYPLLYTGGVVAAGLLLSGGVLLAQAVVYPVYLMVMVQGHRVDGLSSVVAGVLNLGGLSAAVNQGLIFVQTGSGTIPISTTWEKLGLLPWVLLLVGAVVVCMMVFRRWSWWRPIVVFVLLSGVVVVVRLVGMVLWYVSSGELALFWDPWVWVVSFVPVAVVLVYLLGVRWEGLVDDPLKSLRVSRRLVGAGFVVFLCVGFLVGALGWYDGGSEKAGRVLIDEVHSEWEDSVRPLDTEWFGLLSTYNYYSWAEWMNASYAVRRNVDQVLSESVLADVDVLILKCPTNSYSAAEIGAITRFVDAGGGLWLIGDHTDVFGMNTFLNQIAPVFGIRFRNDATYELGSGNMTGVCRPVWFGHPIMRDVDEVRFMTSCSLEGPWGGEQVLLGRRLIVEPGTYATENFFRESVESAEAEFGMFLQMVAVRYGAGRVVAFSDSTVFSSFSFFSDGYADLTAGTLAYLNRVNSSPSVSLVLWIGALVCGGLFVVLLYGQRRQEQLFTVFVAGVLALGVCYPLVMSLNESSDFVSNRVMDVERAWFDVGHTESTIDLEPRVSLFERSDNFGTLYVWSQRVGLTPMMVESIDESLLDARVLVVVNPSVSYDDAEVSVIHRFVEQGGSVLVFDSIQNDGSTANDLVGGFGLWLYLDEEVNQMFSNVSDNSSYIGNMSRPLLRISGGEPLGEDVADRSFIRGVEVVNESTGAVGRVVVVVDSYSFSNKVLGGPLRDPDADQRVLYDTVFYLYKYLLGDSIIGQ